MGLMNADARPCATHDTIGCPCLNRGLATSSAELTQIRMQTAGQPQPLPPVSPVPPFPESKTPSNRP